MRPRPSAPTEPARTTRPPLQRSERRRRDQRLLGKTAGVWLPLRLSMLDGFSKNSVGRTGFEPVTSSVSGNAICRSCSRIFALSCYTWSTLVRWCPSSSAAIVTQLVTRLRARGQTDPLLVSYRRSVGCCRSAGNMASRVTRSVAECRMSLWSPMVVSVRAHGSGGSYPTASLPARTAVRVGYWSTSGPQIP
jgi:hypothetical protein